MSKYLQVSSSSSSSSSSSIFIDICRLRSKCDCSFEIKSRDYPPLIILCTPYSKPPCNLP